MSRCDGCENNDSRCACQKVLSHGSTFLSLPPLNPAENEFVGPDLKKGIEALPKILIAMSEHAATHENPSARRVLRNQIHAMKSLYDQIMKWEHMQLK